MKTGLNRSVAGWLLRRASSVALLVASGAVPQALAATYYVANESQLRNAINAANASADASSKIVFTGNITIIGASVFPNPNKSIEVDTQGFTLRSIQSGAGVGHTNGRTLTLTGTYWGQAVVGSGTIGFNQTGTSAASVIVNNGSILGGNSTGGGVGGTGVSLAGLASFTNNGSITGGTAVNAGTGGVGAYVRNGSSLINYGTIQGGVNLNTGGGGAGIDLGGAGASATVTNHGTIRGGSGLANGSPGSAGGVGVHVRAGGGQIVNTGTIEGNSAAAILANAATVSLDIVNSGEIRGASGSTTAIGWVSGVTPTTGSLTLELQAGSRITGLVVANQAGGDDVLRLGGSANSSFDVSTIGATAQYRNFDRFEKTGSSTWALTSTSSENTTWQLLAGTLSISGEGALGASGGGLIFDGGTLQTTSNVTMTRIATVNAGGGTIETNADLIWSGVFSGSGALSKTGSATLNMTSDSSGFSGPTTVSEGALVVNGSLAGSAVTVQSGARLGGLGTVGALALASGSRITPGNSIGTLTVNGAYVQNAGSVYEVELDPTSGTSDRIDVKGTATLANGASISVINYTGAAFVAGQRYTILTSTGLTGSYGNTDISVSPFLSLRNGTDASNAWLTVVQTRSIGSIGNTGNEQAVGNAVDSLPAGNAVQTELTNAATVEAARGALGQLAGEIHASARTVLVDESWLLRSAVNDRLRSAFGAVGSAPMATLSYGFTADLGPAVKGPMPKPPSAERFAVWGQGYGSWGRTSGDGNAGKLTRSTGGLLVGADAAVFDNLRLGLVAGYSRSTFDVNGRLSSGESDNYHLGLYGGGQWGALNLRSGLSYTWHDLSTRRGIVSAGLGDTLRADYDAGTAQAFGELGYRIDLGQVAFEPYAGLAYVVLRSDRFTERGGAAALSGASDDTSLGYTTLGLRAATTTRLAAMDVTLRGGLGWRHAFGDVDPKVTLAFAGSNPFSIAGLPIARDAALVEAGLDLGLGPNISLGASYTAQLANDAQDHAFKANLAVRF